MAEVGSVEVAPPPEVLRFACQPQAGRVGARYVKKNLDPPRPADLVSAYQYLVQGQARASTLPGTAP